jgi:transcriptional regulator with XRE-family HTH domain
MAKIGNQIKKEVGRRFKRFRESIGKTQTQLANELGVYQSTITNIEVGKTFPNIKYLTYFHKKYRLNTNWLFSDKGDIFIAEEDPATSAASLLNYHLQRSQTTYERYTELMELMQIPVVEQVLLAKLMEIKVIAKEEIEEFRQKEKKIKNA